MTGLWMKGGMLEYVLSLCYKSRLHTQHALEPAAALSSLIARMPQQYISQSDALCSEPKQYSRGSSSDTLDTIGVEHIIGAAESASYSLHSEPHPSESHRRWVHNPACLLGHLRLACVLVATILHEFVTDIIHHIHLEASLQNLMPPYPQSFRPESVVPNCCWDVRVRVEWDHAGAV